MTHCHSCLMRLVLYEYVVVTPVAKPKQCLKHCFTVSRTSKRAVSAEVFHGPNGCTSRSPYLEGQLMLPADLGSMSGTRVHLQKNKPRIYTIYIYNVD